jgi:hypothetical protein
MIDAGAQVSALVAETVRSSGPGTHGTGRLRPCAAEARRPIMSVLWQPRPEGVQAGGPKGALQEGAVLARVRDGQ